MITFLLEKSITEKFKLQTFIVVTSSEVFYYLYYDLLPSGHVLKEAIMESSNQDGDNTKKNTKLSIIQKISKFAPILSIIIY